MTERNIYDAVSFYSGGYNKGNNNFAIINAQSPVIKNTKYYPLMCVVKNLILKGIPNNPSDLIKTNIGISKNEKVYRYISKDVAQWKSTIKGNDKKLDNPAMLFYYSLVPKYLKEYKFIQNLMLPEVYLENIIEDLPKGFTNQQVDFYIPYCRLVIEIDGSQHNLETQNYKDNNRNRLFEKNDIKTIRIDTKNLRNEDEVFVKKINEIKSELLRFNTITQKYKESLMLKDYPRMQKKLDATMRLQVTILHLLERGILKLDSKEWKLCVMNNNETKDYEKHAIKDLFNMFENLCILSNINFREPKLKIVNLPNENRDFIKIDMSLLRKWDDSNLDNETIYCRSDYFDFEEKNYYRVSVSEPIKYSIIPGNERQKKALTALLKYTFGFDDFRMGQIPAIINSLNGEDTIGLLPTGGGKSLIYQFVALLQPSITFVVVPIISLMSDQIQNMKDNYITNIAMINSLLNEKEKATTEMNFGKGKYHIVLISPERFQSKGFRQQLSNINKTYNVGLAVIDEVHCMSEWGHDFRTSYLNLTATIKQYTPSARLLGLTATASQNVLKDLKVEFNIDYENIKTVPKFTRKELTFYVMEDDGTKNNGKLKNLYSLLDQFKDSGNFDRREKYKDLGIIFTRFVNGKKGCFTMSEEISRKYNADVKWYAGSTPKRCSHLKNSRDLNVYKMNTQNDFKESKFPLLVTTKSFGMGIDKDNIRYTVHYTIPPTLESLYQEAGRAGRDGKDAECYVLFSDEDKGKKYIDEIFKTTTPVHKVEYMCEQMEYDGRDIYDNLFLWRSNLKGYKEQRDDMMKVFSRYAKAGSTVEVFGQEIGLDKFDLEKAIYRWSILGVVKDWTIESWDKYKSIIEVEFADYDNESMQESLLKYIRKYEVQFDFNATTTGEFDYKTYYNDTKLSIEDRLIKILLTWQYSNIINFRKESIKTVYELCKNYTSPKKFKDYIEQYFRFDDMTYSFEHIAETPDDLESWFDVFYNKENEIIDIESIQKTIPALRRFLESYINNIGLDFISGFSYILIGDYDHEDGVNRFIKAMKKIDTLEDDKKEFVLNNTLDIGAKLNEEGKEVLAQVLQIAYKDQHQKTIYKKLETKTTLKYLLDNRIDKINTCREGLKW